MSKHIDAMDAARNETIEAYQHRHEVARYAKQDVARRVAAADRAAYHEAVNNGDFNDEYWQWQEMI